MRALTIVLALIALALAGCAGDDDEVATEPPAATEPAPTTEPEPEPPATTADEHAAPIVVDEPQTGATVSSPLHVSGSASVFEANVAIRIRGVDGGVLTETFLTATAGAPERGTFEGDIPFRVDRAQEGTLEVYSPSAEDGSEQHKVEVPLTLRP